MRRDSLGLAVLLVAVLVLHVGCGKYHWVRYRGGVGGARTISIQTLRNESSMPGVEAVVTDALSEEFLERGSLRVVRDRGAADVVLAGRVLPIRIRPRSFSSVSLVLEYEVELSLELSATRRDGGTIELDPAALRQWDVYLASADVGAERKNREEAIRRVASQIATRVHDVLTERLAK
jgi:Lipopolysaccharide-assembly